MNKKEKFINEVKAAIDSLGDTPEQYFSEDAFAYFNALQGAGNEDKPLFTENGRIILTFVKENKDEFNNLFKAKDIAERIGLSTRTVSGGMRKLVSDGYIDKMGANPSVYSLTEKGEEADPSAE